MTKMVRSLTESDLDAMQAIIAERGRQFQSMFVDAKYYSELYKTNVRSGCALGIFIDDVLDGFVLWRMIGASPRAHDATLFDNPCAVVNGNWFRNDPMRERTADGYSVNLGLLLANMMERFEESKIYTFWLVAPAAWEKFQENPVLAPTASRWSLFVSDPILPETEPSGLRADGIKMILPFNRSGEPLSVRARSLMEQHRS